MRAAGLAIGARGLSKGGDEAGNPTRDVTNDLLARHGAAAHPPSRISGPRSAAGVMLFNNLNCAVT